MLVVTKKAEFFSKETLISAMDTHISSQRFLFRSVWNGEPKHFSAVGCVIVKFDWNTYDLICGCSHSSKKSCKHKNSAKWYLYEKNPSLGSSNALSAPEEADKIQQPTNYSLQSMQFDENVHYITKTSI